MNYLKSLRYFEACPDKAGCAANGAVLCKQLNAAATRFRARPTGLSGYCALGVALS